MNAPRVTAAWNAAASLLAGALALGCGWIAVDGATGTRAAPARLSQSGLYADAAADLVARGVLPFEPQYPLWTDGAAKRRWIALPSGAAIDARDPDAWEFPVGTRLWKEFGFERPVETRYMERLRDGSWLYATYAWCADGSDALLVPEQGARALAESAPGVPHDLPSRSDCRACHEGGASAVLGFTALQLSPDRDPLAPHAQVPPPGAVDLPALVERGLVEHLPAELLVHPPRIAAATPRERAVLGYLQGNCGSCHATGGALAELGMALDHPAALAEGERAPALETALDRASGFRVHGSAASLRLASGAPEASVLLARMASRDPLVQMPPFGTRAVDRAALELIEAWLREDVSSPSPRLTWNQGPTSPEHRR